MIQQIDVICPVFREEDGIGLFHSRLSAVLDGLSSRHTFRILYVLDPWPDQTEAKLRSICRDDQRVHVIVMSRRFGHQAALIAGIDHSCADAVMMLDSDLQHPPEIIPEMLRLWEEGAEVVQAIRQDGPETKTARRLTSRWFYNLFFNLGGGDLRAGAADFRLLSRDVAAIFRNQIQEHNPFLRGLVNWVGFQVEFIPFTPGTRQRGNSKYRPSTLTAFALNGICSFSKMPLRFCIVTGIMIAAFSMITAVLQIFLYLFGTRMAAPGWASLFVTVSFLSGIQLVFLGVVGEYISLIFDEVKNRPRYIVARKYSGALEQSKAQAPLVATLSSQAGLHKPELGASLAK